MKRLLVLGCKTMREGVVASAVFFVSGVLMMLAASYVVPDIAYLKHITMLLGLVLMLFAPIILVSTFLVAVLPGAKEKMDTCDH